VIQRQPTFGSRGAFMPKTLSVPLTNVASHSTAYYLLQALNEIGIEYLFCNFGTDHAPLIEELA
jgi:hypothetical protein